MAFTTLNLGYQYAVVKTETVEVGVNVGVSFINAAAGFAGEAIVDDISTVADLDVDFTAPLLVAGAYAEVALRPRAFWNFAFEIFSLKYDQYSGILTNFGSSVEWFPWGHWGFGFEYNLFALDILIENKSDDSVLAFEYRYNGLFFYVAAAW